MKKRNLVKPPTRKELFTLRLMIVLGIASMGFFLVKILDSSIKGNPVLYWMLIVAFVFTCLKILHEWCHYFYITVPELPASKGVYSVDIFTTFCAGEPYAMIEETLIAIQAITYPHKTFLCDEANDPYLKDFCEKIGVHHVTRTVKKNAKAGNINNALAQSSGELCVVLDPDHVPFPDFLDPIVNHFNDPEIGYVQIVQAYKNNEESLIAKGAAQQTYQFYGPMMMTMNRYGTVLAIGANCTFRRTALDSIGGHAAGLAEDMHTSMQLHAKGWKSIYVPVVLARGLVPSTLSAYYSQQLKWSRGVFDLLVTAYPKLFTNFTWRQKLHYGVIPLHYLSGVIFLINFLIPIIALCTNQSPMRVNISEFGLIVLPLVAAIVLIRHFVQWWVMEDKERGFHIVGGLLMIGTWWIFILGFVYTIFRTKVPYVPTPKDGNESNNWPLNIPNLLVLFVSVFAIFYGLNRDWNPYNLIMAVFAALNAFFMCFTIIASRQQQLSTLGRRYGWFHKLSVHLKNIKGNFWIVRRRIYTGVRSMALLITIILVSLVIYLAKFGSHEKMEALEDAKADFFLSGIDVGKVDGKQSFKYPDPNKHFDLISFSIDWDEKGSNQLSAQLLDSIYKKGSIPFITWQLTESQSVNSIKGETIAEKIISGKYDDYLAKISDKVKNLNRPLFMSIALDTIANPKPIGQIKNKPEKGFGTAWKYIHNYLETKAVYNVAWVWNPTRSSTVDDDFPGSQYVDWLAIEPDKFLQQGSSPAVEKNSILGLGIPLLLVQKQLAENPNVSGVKAAKPISFNTGGFSEIKGMIFPDDLHPSRKTDAGTVPFLLTTYSSVFSAEKQGGSPGRSGSVKGVNYYKGQNWQKDLKPFTMDELLSDFQEMKRLGITAVKWNGPGIYDSNILTVASKVGLNIDYCFWINENLDFVKDDESLDDLKKEILRTVNALKDQKNISSWNIGNAVLQKIESKFFKPDLIYQQDAYLYWVKNLVHNIRQLDPSRPVTIDVFLDANISRTVNRISRSVPGIASYGIIADENLEGKNLLTSVEFPYFFSSVSVKAYSTLEPTQKDVFLANWQDVLQTNNVTFNGLKDAWGRNKLSFVQLLQLWKGVNPDQNPVKVKILKPALSTLPGAHLNYYALVSSNDKWHFADSTKNTLRFEWKLVRNDAFGNPVALEDLGKGVRVNLLVPSYPSFYNLYLYVLKGENVIDIIKSELNTPLTHQYD